MRVCVNNNAGDMYISSNLQIKPYLNTRRQHKKHVRRNVPGKSLLAFHGIYRHVLTAGIHVGPRERMREIVGILGPVAQ
jgi:hypothetical protein